MEDRLLQFARKSTGCTLRFGEEGGDANEYREETYTAEGSTTESATSIG